ncbi:MAG TPA: hypothetical protein VFW40_12470 [Capsulimonadaceae bacterium]|nr:hypothetical protein [Capsulimonadaceae bacterium]
MLSDLIIRFFVGGLVVSIFSLLGDLFRPKSFSGLFGAAPSIALATLGLSIAKHGGVYAAVEGRSMVAGAVALWAYSAFGSWLGMRWHWHALASAILAYVVWLGVAFGLWAVFLRQL